jgi:hypothetical protein
MPVSLTSLLGDLSPFTVEEKRRFGEDYVEIVGRQDQWGQWEAKLSSLLGAALKPAGQKPTSEHDRVAGPWGGIQKNQTLFHQKSGPDQVVALVWPWGDGERFTLKMARVVTV